jgi:hypothetical protein
MSIKGIFKPVILVDSGIGMLIDREVLAPPASVTTSLVIASNAYKHMFI